MKNLTEQFLDQIQAQSPEAYELFCDWYEKYKKEVRFDELFNFGAPHYSKQGWHNPKFEDLPLELQNGILMRFKRDMRDLHRTDKDQMADERLEMERVFTRSFFGKLNYEIERGKKL